jgi:hypothetical protein
LDAISVRKYAPGQGFAPAGGDQVLQAVRAGISAGAAQIAVGINALVNTGQLPQCHHVRNP